MSAHIHVLSYQVILFFCPQPENNKEMRFSENSDNGNAPFILKFKI